VRRTNKPASFTTTDNLNKRYRVCFEGPYGPVLTRVLALKELKPYVWPGWLALWESRDGEEILTLISPELKRLYRKLCAEKEAA
jgi:hypothetical protein